MSEELEPYTDPSDISYQDIGIPGYKAPIHNAVLRLRPKEQEEKGTHWLAYTMGPAATLGALIYEGKDEDRMLIEVGRACLSGRRDSRIRVYRNGEKHSFVSLNPEGE